jgi:hypothetical protein
MNNSINLTPRQPHNKIRNPFMLGTSSNNEEAQRTQKSVSKTRIHRISATQKPEVFNQVNSRQAKETTGNSLLPNIMREDLSFISTKSEAVDSAFLNFYPAKETTGNSLFSNIMREDLSFISTKSEEVVNQVSGPAKNSDRYQQISELQKTYVQQNPQINGEDKQLLNKGLNVKMEEGTKEGHLVDIRTIVNRYVPAKTIMNKYLPIETIMNKYLPIETIMNRYI